MKQNVKKLMNSVGKRLTSEWNTYQPDQKQALLKSYTDIITKYVSNISSAAIAAARIRSYTAVFICPRAISRHGSSGHFLHTKDSYPVPAPATPSYTLQDFVVYTAPGTDLPGQPIKGTV
jgi:hypothetical protein